ncbi:hypothetical protein [Paenibacillus sp.]|uniref:hypothetical protein n=1 Tax=Paenibacillus sp. TaxID=58172 RepID=UPI00282693BF|nr:hypothetical protein [Paenibacillus sp.]MDR0268442.1 hypothetical protein [Paenibacillus sp.]
MQPLKKPILAALSIIITLHLALSLPAEAAAAMQWSSSQQAAVDRATAVDATLRSKLGTLYSNFTELQGQLQQTDQNISSLHYKNEEMQTALTQQVKTIDADKITGMDAAVKQAKDKYKPLLATYTALNQQITVANKLKNKQLSSTLKTQADTLKIVVQVAKADIKNKEQALAAAKTKRTTSQKKIRSILAGADPLRIKIKAEKSTATSLNKNISPLWNGVTQSVKSADAKKIYNDLNTLVSQLRQIQTQKQKIITLENQISSILQNAKSQLAQLK